MARQLIERNPLEDQPRMQGSVTRLPLDGVTVLAVEQYGAGPFGTMLLADLGAEVIKIENPAEDGDIGRYVGPHFFSERDSHFFQSFNRNKRSLTLNLKDKLGRGVFLDLVREADAVLNNLRGDLPDKLGLTYESLSQVNPAIVCAHLSGYGRQGSRRAWPGYDYLMQAEAGYLSLTGEPEGPPARFGLSVVDMMTGLMTVFGLLAGVIGARSSGKGTDVDVSLFDTALHNLSYIATWYLNGAHHTTREQRSAHPSLTPSQLYRTRDGWLFVMCNKEKFWPVLADKIGRPEWGKDARFATFKDRLHNREELTRLLDDAFCSRTTPEWIECLGGAVPVAPVYDVAQALDSPLARERGRIAEFERPEGGDLVTMLTSPIMVGGKRLPTAAAPGLGAHTEPMLKRIGLSEGEIRELRRCRAI